MIRNAILRVVRGRPLYTAINVIGLAVGMAASLLIGQYVSEQWSYDAFHPDADRIHRVRFDLYRNGERQFASATTYPAVGPALQEDLPAVEAQARLFLRYGGGVVQTNDRSFRESRVFHADSTFFGVFGYPVVWGDAEAALREPDGAVLSERTARKYFGGTDPIGQQIRFGTDETYTVRAVVRSPETSHLRFDVVFPMAAMASVFPDNWSQYPWSWYDFYTYVRLRSAEDAGAVEQALPAFLQRHIGERRAGRHQFTLQPVRDIHLHSDLIQEARSNGDAATTGILAFVGVLILIVAWVNHVNLATAQALERAREVGVRKTVGATRGQLQRQFIAESVFLNGAGAALAFILAEAAGPLFTRITGRALMVDGGHDLSLIVGGIALLAVGAVASAWYPALVLSRYRPVTVLKGGAPGGVAGTRLRSVLVTVQFATSIALIAATIVVFQQIDFLQNRDLGIDIESVLMLDAPEVIDPDDAYAGRIQSFLNDVEGLAGVKHAAASTEIPGHLIYWASGIQRMDRGAGEGTILYMVGTTDGYFQTYGHEVIAGRALSEDLDAGTSRTVLTERAVQALAFDTPSDALGATLVSPVDSLEVVGVVADYHQQGLHRPVRPVAFRQRPDGQRFRYVSVEASGPPAQLVGPVREIYARHFPGDPYAAAPLADQFDRQYRSYREFGRVVGTFGGLATFVACLGLFGMAAYVTVRRRKEFGVRKALGASRASIVRLLTARYVRLVLWATLVAGVPVWWAMNRWLSGFAYRVSFEPSVIAASAASVAVIALGTVAVQALRAASADPARVLREE